MIPPRRLRRIELFLALAGVLVVGAVVWRLGEWIGG